MTSILAKVTLEAEPWTSDSVVNNFAIEWPGGSSVVPLFDALKDFYVTIPPAGTAAVGSYISSQVSRTVEACRIQLYDITAHLAGTPHGSAFAEDTFTLPAAGTPAQLPSQVAVVMTLRGRNSLLEPAEGPGLTRPRARKTGRLFLGPLGMNAAEQGTAAVGDYARPEGTFINNLMYAAEDLQDELNADGGIWAVWSRSNADLYGVTSVEVDNSFDTLRSRKHDANTRNTRVFAPVPDLALGA